MGGTAKLSPSLAPENCSVKGYLVPCGKGRFRETCPQDTACLWGPFLVWDPKEESWTPACRPAPWAAATSKCLRACDLLPHIWQTETTGECRHPRHW